LRSVLGTAADRRPTLSANDTYDDFDELLDASSLGSNSAEEIQRLVPESVRHALAQQATRRAAPPRRLDVDDAVLDLVSVLQASPDGDHRLPTPPHHDSMEPTPPFSQTGRESKLFQLPHRMRVTLWHAVEPLDTAERLLQVLVEEDAIADVREDVGRALVAAAFSRPAVSSVIVSACLSAMARSHIGDTLADQVTEQWLPRLTSLATSGQPRGAARMAQALSPRSTHSQDQKIRPQIRFSIGSLTSASTSSWTTAIRRALPRLSPISEQIVKWIIVGLGHDGGLLPICGWDYLLAAGASSFPNVDDPASRLAAIPTCSAAPACSTLAAKPMSRRVESWRLTNYLTRMIKRSS
jgi:hypothetical protein